MKYLGWVVPLLSLFPATSALAKAEWSGHYIVKFKDRVALERSLSLMSQRSAVPKDTISQLNMLVVDREAIESDEVRMMGAEIEYIEPDYLVRAIENIQGSQPGQEAKFLWGMRAINAPQAWAHGTGRREVIIAVSDTGIMKSHSDLKDNIWYNSGELGFDAQGIDKSKNKIDDDKNGFVDDYWGWGFDSNTNNPKDDHYHGTHVAGTIGALGDGKGVVGVSWQVQLMSVRFITGSGSGTTANGIRSILYAVDNGAKAVNCSWGGDGYSQALYDAIEYAKEKGVLIVAAAGNKGSDNDKKPHFPSNYTNENLIAVAASDSSKHRPAYFSNRGLTSVDLAAPGVNILSTFNPMRSPQRRERYSKLSGTSMAAPHVSGAIALLYSNNPDLNWREVKEILLSTVTPVESWKGKTVTGGVLNLESAVKAALK